VLELDKLIGKLSLKKVVWVAHDWGYSVVSALAAHYLELCLGVALLSVPY
jgi:soluble epoxide hydrolase/lipid-phosphate phosphatase